MESEKVEQVKILSQEDLEKITPAEPGESVDLWKFDKKEVEIEKAEVVQVPSQFAKIGKQWVLRVSSGVLETLGEGEDKVDFRASELFNLIQDEEGNLLSFPTGEGSNLVKFCKDIGVRDIHEIPNLKTLSEQIVGKKVLVKAYDKEVDGRERTYLKLRY